ncbi:MAG: efflux RND transporter periplasmic adaptor subunit [Thermodesulfobacteriota bacterium]
MRPAYATAGPVLLAALLALAVGCGNGRADATARSEADEPRRVRLVSVTAGTLPVTVTATGTLAAEDQVVLNTKVAGRLAELPVDLGSVVREGDVVAVLDLTDFRLRVEQAQTALAQARARLGVPADGSGDDVSSQVALARASLVRQAKAVLDQARLNRDRLRKLHADGIVARSELDTAEADFRVAEARHHEAVEEVRSRSALVAERRTQLRIAEQQLADATLRAPFDGAVRERHLSIGGYLDVGQPVVTIVRMHPLRLRLAVPEREAAGVEVGQQVGVRVEGEQTVAEGKVARVSPAVDETTRTVMIEAEVPNAQDELRPGSFATGEIVVEPDAPALLAPAGTVVTFAGVSKVLGVEDGKVVEKRVRTGRRVGELVEVLSGVAAGDALIAEPGNLTSGQAVVAGR